jgi:hypothetical protein
MSHCFSIDSHTRGVAMPKSYSCDLRGRVIEMVEAGASRHEAADHFWRKCEFGGQVDAALE